MRCEIVAIGTELLLGHIVDTNSSWIARRLALAGIDSHFQTKVGDNLDRIVQAIEIALNRSEAGIVCGGLGPTHDDLTRNAIARVMGTELVRDSKIVDRIRNMFKERGRVMANNNLTQADIPIGATTIPEQPGTAAGLICPIGKKIIYAVPGVPSDMMAMVNGTIINALRRKAGVSAIIRTRTLRTWGASESLLAELVAPRISALEAIGNPTIAFQASGIEGIKIKITAKAIAEEEVNKILSREENQIRALIGNLVFGVDNNNMEASILQLLEERGLTLAIAESLTGGMLGSRLTDIPGASKVFKGAIVTYANDLKLELLNVSKGPVVSELCAREMATGVRKLLAADVGISVTGVAGPSEQDGQPVGTVFVGLAIHNQIFSKQLLLPPPRQRIREFTIINALNFLRLNLT